MNRFGIGLLGLLLAGAPAAAQNAVAPAPTTNTTTQRAVIGPGINEFNLNGTVTRQAEPSPTTARPAPQRAQPSASADPVQRQAARPAPERPAQPRRVDQAAAPSISPDPAPSPSAASVGPGARQPDAPVRPVAPLPMTALPGEAETGGLPWPWIVAALAAAAAGLFLFRRHQLGQQRYVAAGADLDAAPAETLRRAPVAAPPPAAPVSNGMITSSLRPEIDIDLKPQRAIVNEQGATIEFEVAVRNHGSAPARDVRVEACMVNAGPSQDQELSAFFAHPAEAGNSIPQILPMTEILLKSAVQLKPEQMRQFEVGGRRLFVPLVGVNALYRGPSGPSQTSASYLVGRDGKGEKMAPFRLDIGPKIFRGLGARQHSAGLRT